PAGSADRVLTFRNVHNWAKAGTAEAAFESFFRALKPGGVLGVVEHRAPAGRPLEEQIESGYMTEAYVIEQAENAGFELEANASINANPADDTEHPAGVWTLPPTLRQGEENRARYLEIGESDRMTLRFRKPE
ncbi:MAG TPA: methyltransferase, partial [Alcanivorax sp.]|nr:methyltransferase [Alcanivorax sp.]HBY48780.1 methyltransferase [Alcanivorax sp.]